MNLLRCLAALLPAACAFGQLPDFYQRVERITWVVDDLGRTVAGWKKIGYTQIFDRGELGMDVEVRGKPSKARLRYASGWLGEVWMDWIQILEGESGFSEFQKARRAGVFALNHRAPTCEAMDAEIARLGRLGVAVLHRGVTATSTSIRSRTASTCWASSAVRNRPGRNRPARGFPSTPSPCAAWSRFPPTGAGWGGRR